MLAHALNSGPPARWVTTDEAYGKDSKFGIWPHRRHIGYVLAVPRNQGLPAGSARTRPCRPHTRVGMQAT
jgi:hypothetical protein